MAYFPNGTSGEQYQQEYCERCAHDEKKSCPILLAHLVWNYDQLKEGKEDTQKMLSLFIPDDEARCTMFIESDRVMGLSPVSDRLKEKEKLEKWNSGKPIEVAPISGYRAARGILKK